MLLFQGIASSLETLGMECLSQTVDMDRPEGTYALHLEKPSERGIAVQLIQLNQARGGGFIYNLRQNGLMMSSGIPDGWPGSLPTTGIIEFNFLRTNDAESHSVLDSKKIAALVEEFQRPHMSDSAKLGSITTLSPYTMLYSSQVTRLLRTFDTGDALVHAACMLFTRCVDLEDGADEICGTLPQRDMHFFRQQIGHIISFRGSNPTGHYEMSLNIPHQRMLAIRLKDQAEKEGNSVTWKNVM